MEVEGRQGIAQLFDVPPLPYEEVKIATAERGGQVNALAIDTEAAFLEYLDMFYNLGLAGRAMRRIGAVEFATTIHSAGNDLLALINDILDLSKIEAGQLQIQSEGVLLSRLTNDLRAIFQPIADERGVAFDIVLAEDLPTSIETDRQRLEQVLRNLLSNAFKFTEAGEVRLSGRPLRTWNRAERSRRLAYLAQSEPLPPETRVRDVVTLGRGAGDWRWGLLPRSPWTQADEDAVDAALDRTDTRQFEERRVTELLTHLLRNALHHGAPARDQPHVVTVQAQRHPHAWHLTVQDSGPGIPGERGEHEHHVQHHHADQHRAQTAEAAPARQQAAGNAFTHARQPQAVGHHAEDQAADENGGESVNQRHGVAEYGAEHELVQRGQHAHMHDGHA